MKTIILFIMLCGIDYTPPIYWQQMTLEQRQAVLQLEDVSADAIAYYENSGANADNINILNLLQTIIQPQTNVGIKAFYFNVFNMLVYSSDDKLNHILPSYMVDLVLNEPQYVLNYFIRNGEAMQLYGSILGKAFFNQNEPSNGLCTFKDFQDLLTDRKSVV